jgi:N-acetylmuramoyl-L-alanine amidase
VGRLLGAALLAGAAMWAVACGSGHAATAARAQQAAPPTVRVHDPETSAITVGNSTPSQPAPAAPSLAGRTITIDAGHNGGNFTHPQQIAHLVPDGNGEKECDTTGTAAPDGYRETDFNWDVALRLRALLQAEHAKVVMTRDSNTGVGPCVNERAAIGNRAHSDAAISIHGDGGPPGGSGFAILTPAPIPSRSDQAIILPSAHLALKLRTSLLEAGLHPSNYDGKQGIAPRTDLGGLNLSNVPKVFVEVANMQNRADEAPMERPAFREHVARALAAGLTHYLRRG